MEPYVAYDYWDDYAEGDDDLYVESDYWDADYCDGDLPDAIDFSMFGGPAGYYPRPDRKKKRREVIDDAVEQAAEYVAQTAQLPSIPIDDAQIRAIAARIRKAVPQPVKGASAKAWQADNEAIMKAIDAEISRLIAERKESDDYMGLAMMLVMAS